MCLPGIKGGEKKNKYYSFYVFSWHPGSLSLDGEEKTAGTRAGLILQGPDAHKTPLWMKRGEEEGQGEETHLFLLPAFAQTLL